MDSAAESIREGNWGKNEHSTTVSTINGSPKERTGRTSSAPDMGTNAGLS